MLPRVLTILPANKRGWLRNQSSGFASVDPSARLNTIRSARPNAAKLDILPCYCAVIGPDIDRPIAIKNMPALWYGQYANGIMVLHLLTDQV